MRTPLSLISPALFLAFLSGCADTSDTAVTSVGCDYYEDHSAEGLATFRVRNETGLDVYLPAACDVAEFTVEKSPTPDPDIAYGTSGRTCLQTCETLQKEEPYVCESSGCAPASIRVPAGASVDVQWGGTGRQEQEMPAECWLSDNPEASCTQIVRALPALYKVSFRGFTECGDACTCNAAGICNGEATGLEATVQSFAFDYPAVPPVVEVVFDACAFGCAGG